MRQQDAVARVQPKGRYDGSGEQKGECNHADTHPVQQEGNKKTSNRAADLKHPHCAVGLRVGESIIGKNRWHPQGNEIMASKCGDESKP